MWLRRGTQPVAALELPKLPLENALQLAHLYASAGHEGRGGAA